jgi:ABC-2 type transport system ATP-binding protein
MIIVNNLRKSYGGHLVIEVPKLQLNDGIHWFKGANGSGKTTFFRTLAGMLPFEGDIQLTGLDIRKDPVAYRMAINYGEAEPTYPTFLTANDLIQFVAKAKKATKSQVDSLIERIGVIPFLYQPTGSYSSGMLKKTSLVLSFLGNPKVIILDEPLITIDEATVNEVYHLVVEHYGQGISFLLSSHQDFRFESLPVSSTFRVANKQIIQL